MYPRPSGLVTLTTDFGLADPYVGIMKGAALRAASRVQCVDITHGVPPQDVEAGAFLVRTLVGRFPAGTVHAVVVDPGVGTARRLLAVAAHDDYWLGPDNGVLSLVLGGDVRVIDAARLGLRAASSTFHGRDIVAPVAAWLATGRYGFDSLGPRIADPVPGPSLEGPPRIVHVDGYGNLITNVPAERLAGVRRVQVAGNSVPLVSTYAEAPAGGLLALVGSYGLLEVAQNGGSAERTLGLARGAPIDLVLP